MAYLVALSRGGQRGPWRTWSRHSLGLAWAEVAIGRLSAEDVAGYPPKMWPVIVNV
jgi:hypothetical protein